MGISSTEMRIASTKVNTKINGESNKKNACLCQFVPAKNMLTNRNGEFNQHKYIYIYSWAFGRNIGVYQLLLRLIVNEYMQSSNVLDTTINAANS